MVAGGDHNGIFVHQEKYTKKIIDTFNMTFAKPATNPIASLDENDETQLDPTVPFRAAVGSLAFLADTPRPDISFAVNQLASGWQNLEKWTGNEPNKFFDIWLGQQIMESTIVTKRTSTAWLDTVTATLLVINSQANQQQDGPFYTTEAYFIGNHNCKDMSVYYQQSRR